MKHGKIGKRHEMTFKKKEATGMTKIQNTKKIILIINLKNGI